jgi:hypothetical protein
MAKADEKLCPDCPLSYVQCEQVLKDLREEQQRYSNKVEEPTPHKVCLRRRLRLKELGLACPYFYETETLDHIRQQPPARAVPIIVLRIEPIETPQPQEAEAVNPLRTLTVKKQRRQTLIIENRGQS